MPVRVFVIPTRACHSDLCGCNLHRLFINLNNVQKVFEFKVTPELSAAKLVIARNRVVANELLPSKPNQEVSKENREQRDQYISDLDAFEQIAKFAEEELHSSHDDIIIVISSQIFIPENIEEKISGDPKLDAYSCLSNAISMGDIDNNNPKKFHNIVLLSTVRLSIVFPGLWEEAITIKLLEILESRGMNARRKVARYIIGNVAHALSTKSFGKSLTREHRAKCVAENNWLDLGGETDSYWARGLCGDCETKAGQYGLARMYETKGLETGDVVKAIGKIAGVADDIDRMVKEQNAYRVLMAFALITMAVGLSANLIAGYAIGWDTPNWGVWNYIRDHLFASILVLFFAILGVIFAYRNWTINRRLP
jgi:hypothetical protein